MKLRADEMDSVSFGALRGMQRKKTFEWYYQEYMNLIEDMKKVPRRSRLG
jgi:hypothetical protein